MRVAASSNAPRTGARDDRSKGIFKTIYKGPLSSVPELKLFQIKLGTIDQNEADMEWVYKPYMNTAKKNRLI